MFEEAGTTRDSVDALLEWPDGPVRFVDTAGMRRQTRVTGIEYYSFVRATRAIERADVAVVVIEAPEGFTSEDKKIVVRVLDAGRGLLIAANKWDLVEEKDRTFKLLSEEAALFANATIMRTSATRGQGVHRLPPLLMDLHRALGAPRVSTAKVNEVLQEAQRQLPTPRNAGNLHYATQVGSGPPSFVIFGGSREPDPSYQRYLENRLAPDVRLRRRAHPPDVPAADARAEAGRETSLVRPGLPVAADPRTTRSEVATAPLIRCRSRDVAQPGSALVWGTRGRGFKSRRPDHRSDRWARAGRVMEGTDMPERTSSAVFTIPNLLSFLRILLIPVFVALIVHEPHRRPRASSCSGWSSRPIGSTAGWPAGPDRSPSWARSSTRRPTGSRSPPA